MAATTRALLILNTKYPWWTIRPATLRAQTNKKEKSTAQKQPVRLQLAANNSLVMSNFADFYYLSA